VTIRAVLFDVGGPLDTEVISERLWDEHIRAALAETGIVVSAAEVTAASDRAVASFAPNAYTAMLWDLAGEDEERARAAFAVCAARGQERREARGGFELREGIRSVLQELRSDGLLLGLAANQPVAVLPELDRAGIGQYFAHREVSGHHGYRKPDVRLFLRACEDLGVEPAECVMVGDRIDNDIFPATLLGIATVLIRTGRHIAQQPRSFEEIPDAECRDAAGLLVAVRALSEARSTR
jgi:putative hydrolase of the HAD superfamily